MYQPVSFQENDVETLHEAIRQAELVILVTVGADGPTASHVPMLLDPAPAPYGTLRGHLARANPQWKDLAAGQPALAIFQGPDAYISPSWYATKKQTGKVVPTWNYVAIHAAGPITFFDDADKLLALVTELTSRHEGPRREPWAVSDAPADFIQGMLRAIVGFELRIEQLEGKWKMSQNRPAEDRPGIVAGLRDEGGAKGAAVAAVVTERNR
jgi:transcriptional regulator